MDFSKASKAHKGLIDEDNTESSGARRFRNFSPEPNDDEFQQSPFRSTRTEKSSTRKNEVGSKCAVFGYADVEDIVDKALYKKTSAKPNSKRSIALTRQTCKDSTHGNAQYYRTASATEESENLFQDILKKAKRLTPPTAFSEFVGPEEPLKWTYARKGKANTSCAYKEPSSTTVHILSATSKDHSAIGENNAGT